MLVFSVHLTFFPVHLCYLSCRALCATRRNLGPDYIFAAEPPTRSVCSAAISSAHSLFTQVPAITTISPASKANSSSPPPTRIRVMCALELRMDSPKIALDLRSKRREEWCPE